MTNTTRQLATVRVASYNTAAFQWWAYIPPAGKGEGPFDSEWKAEAARERNNGAGRIVRCTSLGFLEPVVAPGSGYWDLGSIREPLDEPPYVPAASVGLRYTGTGTVGEVHAPSAERVARQDAVLRERGIVLPPPVYAPGSLTESETAGRMFRISHTEHEKLPQVTDTLRDIRDAVQAERRRDVIVTAMNLRMHADGRLYRLDGSRDGDGKPFALGLERGGLRQLCSRMSDVFPSAAEFLEALDPEERAAAFNAQVVKVDPEQQLKLRLRRLPNSTAPSIFAAVGPKYAVFDADQIAGTLLPAIESWAAEYETQIPRGIGLYRPETSALRVDAVIHADTIVDAAAGDVFKAGVRFRSSDTGGGSVSADLLVWRNSCLNFIVVSRGEVNILRRAHRGNMAGVTVDLTGAVQQAQEFVASFAQDWGLLRRAPIKRVKLWGESYNSVPEALKALVDQKKIDGITANAVATEMLLTSWSKEPGETLADLINAVTRYAHTAKHGVDTQEKVERSAGELVPVLVRAASQAFA